MIRAIGYVRQSRKSEAGGSPEAQRQAVQAFISSQGWTYVDTLSDIGKSGYDPNVVRPGLDEAFKLIEAGGIERVVVWKFDRLTRRGIVEAMQAVKRIEDTGASLVSVTEPIDTSSAIGRGIMALLWSLAEAESEKIRERTMEAKAVVKERGGWMGGPVPYGFVRERVAVGANVQSQLALDPERALIVRRMVDQVLGGMSTRKMVEKLNEDGIRPARGGRWSHASALRLLRSPYLGGFHPDGSGGILRDDQGRPRVLGASIISPEEWQQLQRRMVPRAGRRPDQPSLLGGVAICAGCGGPMGANHSANRYRCSRSAHDEGACPAAAMVPMTATDDYVTDRLAEEIRQVVGGQKYPGHPGARDRFLQRLARWWTLREGTADLTALVAERDLLEQEMGRLRELYVAGDFQDDPEQYRRLHSGYEARRAALTETLGTLDRLPTPKAVADPLFVDRGLDLDTRRELIKLMVQVECVKAHAPGVRFHPEARVRLGLKLEWDRLIAIAAGAGDPATWTDEQVAQAKADMITEAGADDQADRAALVAAEMERLKAEALAQGKTIVY